MAKPPPPLRHLYHRITSFPTLLAAFRKASKGKRYRPDVLAFAANLEAELFQVQQELKSFSYVPATTVCSAFAGACGIAIGLSPSVGSAKRGPAPRP